MVSFPWSLQERRGNKSGALASQCGLGSNPGLDVIFGSGEVFSN